ncbi:MAG TPA: GTP-binding protein [Thermoleophilaceae bacterium]|nr:GTP-binding protein [Thermoleophilaceae bacterium]
MPGQATNGSAFAVPQVELLRLATAGSVDDGKSTLIGRLLYDSKSILQDQLDQVADASRRRHGDGTLDLSLLTDGLRAEREQGITIDVAYRYFATPRRRFIIADTPGHEQYTRNMVTGASTADLAIVLVDARNGVVEQSRRHTFLTTLLRVPHLVVAVNKMDLVGYDEADFDRIVAEFTQFARKLQVADLTFIPVSALHGDNVVERSENMRWYGGTPLLYHLEHVHIASDRNLIDPRLPVQWVIRPGTDEHHDYRGYAGMVASGTFRPGDEIMVLPAAKTARIETVSTFDGPREAVTPGESVIVHLDRDIDVSRGDMLCRTANQPVVSRALEAQVCWMNERPLAPGGRYALKHTTRWARAIVDELRYRIDINTLHRDESATELGLNQIGRVSLRTSVPIVHDEFRRNRTTGSFILVAEDTNETVGAGMILSDYG